MSLAVEQSSSPVEPLVALLGPSDGKETAISRDSLLQPDSRLAHIFVGPGVVGPAVHLLDLLHQNPS